MGVMKNQVLLLSAKQDVERAEVAAAWKNLGGEVRLLAKFWIKPSLSEFKPVIYGGSSFALVLAQLLDLELLSPKDEDIVTFDYQWTKRRMQLCELSEAVNFHWPMFVKPVIPKEFIAQVYASHQELMEVTKGLPNTSLIIASEPVHIEHEVRCFVKDRHVLDAAYYEGLGDLETPLAFATDFLQKEETEFPESFVLDLAYSIERGWFVLELNAAWGAGLNGCTAAKVLPAIAAATISND